MTRTAKWVVGLSCANLIVLSLVNYLLYYVSEAWWLGTVLTYAPRVVFLIPVSILLLMSLIWHRPSLGMNLVSVAIVLVPVMALSIPFELWLNGAPTTEGETVLKIVGCNVQSFQPDFNKVLEEIAVLKPDIVALQEAFGENEQADQFFREWSLMRQGQYRVYSRFRISLISDCEVTQFGGRLAGIVVQVESPGGPIAVAVIHQMTARFGLKELSGDTLISGKGTRELEEYVHERDRESTDIRTAVDSARDSMPLVVCGDFNAPTFSHLFRKHWGDLNSSFDAAGFGYGYTSPCKGNRLWPDDMPWARIDHILCSHEWTVRDCQIGKSAGSDHRLIAATIVLKTGRSD